MAPAVYPRGVGSGNFMNILLQLAMLLLICLAGEGLALLLPFAFPSSVISMLLLFLLLLTGAIKLCQIDDVTGFLTKNMAFFFIPAGVEIMENYQPVADRILPLLCVLVLTTVITFAVTAYTVRLCLFVQKKLGGNRA